MACLATSLAGAKSPRTRIVLSIVAALIFFAPMADAAPCDYWVASSGSNSSPGTNASPWATLSYAVSAVPDTGRTVCVKDGTYTARVTINRRFTQMATFRAENPYRALLQANDTVIYSFGGRNITLEGFEVKHSGSSTSYVVQIQMNDDVAGDFSRRAENIVLRNNILHDSLNNDIVKVNNGAHFITIEGNVFYNQAGLDQLIDANSVQDVTIQDNIFFNDFAGSGRVNQNDTAAFVVVKDSGGPGDGYTGAQRVNIRRNVFLNWQGINDNNFILNGDDGNAYYESLDVMMENNLMIGNSANDMRTAMGVKGCKNITFRNNTVVGNLPSCAYAMRLNQEPGNLANENIAFYNNIWSDPTGTMGAGCGSGNDFSDGTAAETNGELLDRNLYWNGGAVIPAGDVLSPLVNDVNRLVADPLLNPNQTGVVLPRWQGTAFASGNTTIRQEFVRLVNTYGAVPANSPVVGAAVATRAPADDILGNPRVSPELGAFEVVSAAAAPTLSVSDASVTEGQSGATTTTFTVTLQAPASVSAAASVRTKLDAGPAAGPDVAVSLSGESERVELGSDVFYTATVSNVGSAAATGTRLVLELPVELTLVSASPECTAVLGTVTCDFGLLPAGGQVQAEIRGGGVTEGTHRVEARVQTSGEANVANNVATRLTSVQPTESGNAAVVATEPLADAIGTVTVQYATANGTATAGSDYTATAGTLTFPPGVTIQTVSVTVTGDTNAEPNETFMVNLSNPAGATVLDGQGVGTIANDDSASIPQLSIDDVSLTESNGGTKSATFTATLSAAASGPVTVQFATANVTATAGSDYAATAGTLTFAPGVTTQTVSVTVGGDTNVEPNETFTVNLGNPAGATILDTQGIGTILNDDYASIPQLSINDVAIFEGRRGFRTATFTVRLSAASSGTVTVSYATANGTAIAGSDYVAAAGALTFLPGVTSQTITVSVKGDRTREPNETFFVNLSPPAGASVLDGQGQGTIVNDD